MTIAPGDHMHAVDRRGRAGLERLDDHAPGRDADESFSQTVPYPSSHLTAEWIEETPLLLGTERRLRGAAEPDEPGLHQRDVNGQPANLHRVRGDRS